MAALKAAFLLLMYSLYASARDSGSSVIRQDLNSNDWDISNQNGTIDVGPVQLPVMVLEALYNAGQLPDGDPISRYNDRNYKWVAYDTWTFQTEFNASEDILDQQKVDLVLNGVDTVAEIYVNDKLVVETHNAHREFRIPVKSHLMEGTNLLTVVFLPAPMYAKMKAAEYPFTVPMQTYVRGIDHYNFIRKPASDFGWDWGPAIAPMGIYGNVVLEAYSTAFLTGASIRQQHAEDGQVDVFFDAVLQGAVQGETGSLMTEADQEAWMGAQQVTIENAGNGEAGENIVSVKVTIKDDYNLWWPVGFGTPYLYNFTLSYVPDSNSSSSGGESTLARRLGIRTIELVEEPLRDPSGFSFYFRVNGVPLYARGANMIPLQVFHSQNSAAKYRRTVEDAVEANMNMLRIWGGGLYQTDAFYDIADEMGVLVWQEAMFACAMYPRDSSFLKDVASEISYQARRIGHHASLAIWGGNNEVETAFAWFPESRSNVNLFSVDYTALFVETVRKAVVAVDPGMPFVDSSPSKGVYSLDPYTKRWGNPSAVNAGDVHFYDYSSNCLDPAVYPRAKLVSEYGFQSFPSFSVYKQYTEPQDWSVNSNMSDYRQRHPNGNSELMTQMQSHFVPIAYNSTSSSLQQRLFQQWIYLTQVQQSLCYETAIANWRRLKAAPDARNMGVLYWQLNDIWAGPSWSGIDFGGHWRLLMYNVRKLFSPVAVSGTYNITQADALSVYVTNDQPWSVTGDVTVEVISWGARSYDQPVVTKKVSYDLAPLGSKVVTTMPIKSSLANSSLTLMDAVVRLRATAEGDSKELAAQTCMRNEDDPFTSICTPAKGMNAIPATANGKALKTSAQGSYSGASSTEPPSIFTQNAGSSRVSYDSSQVVWLSEPKEATLPLAPHIRVSSFQQKSSKIATFRISSRNVAALVYLDSDKVDGIFSDNGFLLLPWEPHTLTFTSRSEFSAADLQSSLTFISLADTLAGGGLVTS